MHGKLIAFLKAMEFTTLTRRVADYSQHRSVGRGSGYGEQERGRKGCGSAAPAKASAGGTGDLFAGAATPVAKPGAAKRRQGRERQGYTGLARRGTRGSHPEDCVRSQEISDHQQPRSAQGLDRARARYRPLVIEAMSNSIDPMQAEISGVALALAPEQCLLRPARPQAIRRRHRPVRCRPCPGPDQGREALAVLKPVLESAGILKIGFNIKFNAVMLAQHGITLRNHDDAQLMSYALDAGRNAHGIEALAERMARPRRHRLRRTHRQRQGQADVRSGRDRQGDRIFGRKRRRDVEAVAGAEAAAGRRAHDGGL